MASSRTSLLFFLALIDTSTLTSLTFASLPGRPWSGVSDGPGLCQSFGRGWVGYGHCGSHFLWWPARRVLQGRHRRSLGSVLLLEIAMRKVGGLPLVALGCGVSFAIFMTSVLPAAAAPTVFWVSEPVQSGEVVLLYGGGLGEVREVTVRRLSDDAPGVPPPQSIASEAEAVRVPTLQPSDSSLKFMLPTGMSMGVFAVAFGGGPRLINVPKVEWCQPTRLLPGLNENEAAPGATVQIIGRNCLLDESLHEKVKVALRGQDGRILWLKVVRAEKYAIVAELPADLSIGEYQVWVHNGSGGPAGWGSGTSLTIKRPAAWPADVFNIKDFGAQGN